VKKKYLLITTIVLFILGSTLVMAALWPSRYEEVDRELPTEMTVGEGIELLPAYRLIFRYTPTLKVGMQNSFHLQVITLGEDPTGSQSLWSHYRVELVVHVEINNPEIRTEPFGHIHLPWLARAGLASTWNVYSNSPIETSAVLWLFVHVTSLSGATEEEIPLYAIPLVLRSITVLGMSTILATVVGGFCIFISIVTAGLFVYSSAISGSGKGKFGKRALKLSRKNGKRK
jgi:hypothetical protein